MSKAINQGTWEPCPRCQSANVVMIQKWGLFSFFLILGLMSLLAGILIWILLPVALGLLIACVVTLFVPKKMYCNTCKYFWKNDKELSKTV